MTFAEMRPEEEPIVGVARGQEATEGLRASATDMCWLPRQGRMPEQRPA